MNQASRCVGAAAALVVACVACGGGEFAAQGSDAGGAQSEAGAPEAASSSSSSSGAVDGGTDDAGGELEAAADVVAGDVQEGDDAQPGPLGCCSAPNLPPKACDGEVWACDADGGTAFCGWTAPMRTCKLGDVCWFVAQDGGEAQGKVAPCH
jgi:hypothetical protein